MSPRPPCPRALLRRLAGVLLLYALALPLAAQMLGEPRFESVGDGESVPDGVVTALAQDSRGLLWIGSMNGLVRFDGYRFRRFRHVPGEAGSLPDDIIRDLAPTKDGGLWVATQGGGIARFDWRSERFTTFTHSADDPHSLATTATLALALDADGGLWIGTAGNGLDYLPAQGTRFEHHPAQPNVAGGLTNDNVRCLLIDRDGDLWIGGRHGLERRRRGSATFERVASDPADPDSLGNDYVYALYQASDGRIWVGTQGRGAGWIENDRLHLLPVGAASGGLSHPWINGFAEPLPGELWLSSFGGGIDIIDGVDGRVLHRLRHDPALRGSLALDYVTHPMLDLSGQLWLGTWGGGLQRHNPAARAFRTLHHSPTRADGLSHPSVLAALELDDGRIWLGTAGNGIDVLDPVQGRVVGGIRAQPGQAGALGDGTIRTLAQTRDGSVFVGTQQAGLYRYLGSDRGFRPIAKAGGSADPRISRLLASRSGALWVASERGLARLDPASEQVTALRLADGSVFADQVRALTEEANGRLWVASTSGLWMLEPDQTVLRPVDMTPGRPGGLSHSTVLALLADRRRRLWVATPAGLDQLQRWDGEQPWFEPLPVKFAQPDRAFSSNNLLDDAAGRLWTERLMIDPARRDSVEFGRAEGIDLGSVSLGANAKTRAGMLLFGGTRGLLAIDPERFSPWRFAPPLAVTGLDVDGEPQPLARLEPELVLAADVRRFSIEFSALDLTAPERNRYAYRLVGLDEQWIEADAGHRLAQYSRLWPGRYVLELRGSNRTGEWSPQKLQIPLRVLPAFWQTGWFATVLLLATAGALAAGYRLRTAAMRRRAEALQALVERRTAQLSEAKQRAEDALAELRGAQKQLVAAEKMASLGGLVAGVAHEINTPMGIALTAASSLQKSADAAFAKLDAGKLSRRDMDELRATLGEANRLILGSLQRASTLIASFKQVAVDQSSEQRRAFDLQQFLGEVQFALQPVYARTPHRLAIDCPEGIAMDTYPGALFQIVTNLVNNALLHAFAEDQAGQMRLQARALGEQVELRFRDDGLGMSAEIAARAFDPFFTTRRGSGGSGLGLHLVYNLTTQLLGGTIELHTAPGAGCEFVIRLPRQAPER